MSLTPGSCSPFKLKFRKGKASAGGDDDDDGDEVVIMVHRCAHCGGRGRGLRGGKSVCRDCGWETGDGRAATV